MPMSFRVNLLTVHRVLYWFLWFSLFTDWVHVEAVLLKTSHTFKIQVIQLHILQLEPAYFQLLPYHQVLLSMIIKSIKLMCEKKVSCFHNMSYLTDSYISFTLKLESWQKFCFNSLIRSSKYGKKKYFWFSSMREDGCFCYWICDFPQN